MGGLFHSDPKGNVTRYGENLATNGVVLSPDEKTLYVTNSGTVAAFDVQPDGSLTNQRQFVKLPSGGGDGMTIDAQGRLYVTAGPAVHVVAPDGKLLGSIPAPYGLITTAFAGKDKKNAVRAWSASSTRCACSMRTSIQSRCRRRGMRDARSSTWLAAAFIFRASAATARNLFRPRGRTRRPAPCPPRGSASG